MSYKSASPAPKTKATRSKTALAPLHSEIVKGKFNLRQTDTSVQYDKVVCVPKDQVRTFQFGSVRPSKTAPTDVASASLWARIRHGPTALENPKIRQAIVNGDFSLRPTQTRESRFPVVLPPAPSKLQPVHKELYAFDKKGLRSVKTRTTYTPVMDKTILPELRKRIVFFPFVQLNHVLPRVTYTPVVSTSTEEKKAEKKELNSTILRAVVAFDQKRLKKVATRVAYAPQIIVKEEMKVEQVKQEKKEEKEEQKEKKEEKKSADPAVLKAALENVDRLSTMGFSDKKKSFNLLLKNGNDLVAALEALLDETLLKK